MSQLMGNPVSLVGQARAIGSHLRLSKAARQTLFLFICKIGGIVLGFGELDQHPNPGTF
jgi:hypothetical protein